MPAIVALAIFPAMVLNFRSGFINPQRAAMEEGARRLFCLIRIRHFHKRESTRVAAVAVHDNADRFDSPVRREGSAKLLFRGCEVQVTDKNVGQLTLPLKTKRRPAKGRPSTSKLRGANVLCLPALRSLGHVKLDGLTFLQAAEAARLDG